MLDDIALFIQVVRQGSLSAAAQHLGLPPATVTRRLQKLEQRFSNQLLHRSARQFVLTQEGEIFYRAYAELIEELERVSQELSQELKQLAGKLRVLAPTNFSHGILRPMWLNFTQTYPEIELELILGNEVVDMTKSRADLAIRIGKQADSLLYQQKLGQLETILVASSRYLENAPELSHPSELKNHRVIGSTLRTKWTLNHILSKASQDIYPRFNTVSNDLNFAKHMALDNQGIALLPITEIKEDLDKSALVHVLPEWQGEAREIFAVWSSGRLLSKKAELLREHIKLFLNENL